MRRLFVVRHGNTFEDSEISRRIGARTDLPLVAGGVRQASALADLFASRGIVFARVLAAPLQRTAATAGIILHRMGSDRSVETASWLAEIDHGPDEGKRDEEIVARVGSEALRAWDEQGVAPSGWHVEGATRSRAWRALLGALPEGDTLVVTSNGAARFLFLAETSLRPAGSLKLRTGAFAMVARRHHRWQLLEWNVKP